MTKTNQTSLAMSSQALTPFSQRHIGPSTSEQSEMLSFLGVKNREAFIESTLPQRIRRKRDIVLEAPLSEAALLSRLADLAKQNTVATNFIGQGYYGTHTPSVILRNILEDPRWYTAYTPYQAEISQGRMEALLNFQTMVTDLTAMDIANASLLDEGTALAEAMSLALQQYKGESQTLYVADDVHPQNLDVLKRRAKPLGLQVKIFTPGQFRPDEAYFAVAVQYPNTFGEIQDYQSLATEVHAQGALVIVATDLMALTELTPPGAWGADIVVGSSQRFGVPMGFGGPHAAFLATKDAYKRAMPGRIIGVSKDAQGKPALRLALQTREQHIRREKATSNICTAQVLLAVVASMYAVYHGPSGLRAISAHIRALTQAFRALWPQDSRLRLVSKNTYDTLVGHFESEELATAFFESLGRRAINVRIVNRQSFACSLDETHTPQQVAELLGLLCQALGQVQPSEAQVRQAYDAALTKSPSPEFSRPTNYLTHPVFHRYHSETEMLRYITHLASKDLTLAQSMIPLGSCTMKLNATSEMEAVTWAAFGQLHPFAPASQVKGTLTLIKELERDLCQLTGFAAVSLQPNAGSAGEYAGLLAIRDYHLSRGEGHRNICLIPSSAHGTNPASAIMAGLKVAVVNCDTQGNIDLADLEAKVKQHSAQLAALMVTYPSTHGVFEEGISHICELVHAHGGQVYMDGANFNALVGLSLPGEFGPDVCHLNLHKTFCIPHGGGGPGVGPIGVAAHLKPFLPGHRYGQSYGLTGSANTAVASAPFGSASILIISWAYIKLMGLEGLTQATELAILNANYMAKRLESAFPILYKGQNGRVAHECIVDVRPLKSKAHVDVEDIAKRLMDYGFHAPTMSWPVAGTLMIEPTESESKAELDRFCEAMLSIHAEAEKVASGVWPKDNNPLKHAPHTVDVVTADAWDRPYARTEAVYPLSYVRERKFWPSVSRVDNAYGDRNLHCTCLPLDAYA